MKKKILFIDDELDEENSQAYQISKDLSNRGFDILPCLSFEWEEISKIIKENYRSLRLILCDLKDSKSNPTGWNTISTIKSPENKKHLIEGIDWFIECLPIIVITQVPEYQEEIKEHGGELVTLFDKTACQGQAFRGCVEILTNLFHKLCQNEMSNRIAISYTWNNKQAQDNHQPFVEHIAQKLYQEFKRESVFYDKDKISKTAGTKSNELTKNIYGEGCDFVLIFLSNDYATSGWTKKEWEQTKMRADNKYLFVAIEDLKQFEVAKNLFPEEWTIEVKDEDDEEEKNRFFNKHMPLYFDCYNLKKKFDSIREHNMLDAYNRVIESMENDINKIVDNIKTRI